MWVRFRPNVTRLPSSIAWVPDGQSLLIIDQDARDRAEGVFLLPLDGHEKRRLTSPPPGSWDAFPALSPDGRTLAFSRMNRNAADGIFMVPLSSDLRPLGAPKELMTSTVGDGLAWTVDGRDVIAGAVSNSGGGTSNLWRIAADGSRAPRRLSVGDQCGSPAVSARGAELAYACNTTDANIWRIDLDHAAAAPVRLISSTRQDNSAQFSPDGKKIAFYSTRSGNPEIWVCNRDGTNAVQVTSLGGPPCGTPRWSPDGERIVFDSSLNGQWGVFTVAASGGRLVALTDAPSFNAIPSWSHDGKWIYFCSDRGGTREIWRMPAQGGGAVQVTHKGALAALESADGKFV